MESDRKGGFMHPQCLTCLPPPLLHSAVDFPVRPEGGIMLGEITPHLYGSAPSSEICDRAKRRHPQLLSSSLYLPPFLGGSPHTSAYSHGWSRSR